MTGNAAHHPVVQWQRVIGRRDGNADHMFSGADAVNMAVDAKAGEGLDEVTGAGSGGGMTVGAGVVYYSTDVGADEQNDHSKPLCHHFYYASFHRYAPCPVIGLLTGFYCSG